MEKPRPASIAWGALIGGVALYDYLAPDGETLSEGVDRALEHKTGRFLAVGAIAITASHLLNILPQKYDPIHNLPKILRIK